MNMYRIAIYIRLSKEDDKIKEESNSITMQRILLHKYAKEHFGAYELSEFCDDGYTGTNFERPGVQKLLEKVRDLKIDCILVKDFSRFARDYIELGSYLEQIFPFLGVRFISINDHYDSQNYQGSIAQIDVNFRNLLYDWYSKDLSQKVRASLTARKEQGQYISANSPFGYEKDAGDRHRLRIAEDEAQVIRSIFSLTAEGYTSTQIARMFNENHVKTPIEFKIEKGKTKRKPKGDRFLWSSSTICQILRNEIYIGNIVQRKYQKDFPGGKNHLRARQEWLRGYAHHEPIIEQDMFLQVQKTRGKKRNPQQRKTHPLTGKLVCGCCKKNLQYQSGKNPYFTCKNRYVNAWKDCVYKVNLMSLESYLWRQIREKLQADKEVEPFSADMRLQMKCEIAALQEQQEQLNGSIPKIRKKNFEAYADYVAGKREKFQSKEVLIQSIQKEAAAIGEKIRKLQDSYSQAAREQGSLCAEHPLPEQFKEILDYYIEKVVVHEEQHMEIFWRERNIP